MSATFPNSEKGYLVAALNERTHDFLAGRRILPFVDPPEPSAQPVAVKDYPTKPLLLQPVAGEANS